MYLYNAATSTAVSVKLAEMQFRLLLGYSSTCHYHLASSNTI